MKPSLLATIHGVRPDLVPEPGSGNPIEDRFGIQKQEDSKPLAPRILGFEISVKFLITIKVLLQNKNLEIFHIIM